MKYSQTVWRDTRMHVLQFDSANYRLAAVVVGDQFPMVRIGQPRPPQLAEAAGALASVGAGFMISHWAGYGITEQPKQILMIDREIWTTGAGHGGTMFASSDDSFYLAPTKVEIQLWGSGAHLRVNSVNGPPISGRDVDVFTYRGGSNVYPTPDHFHTILGNPEPWELVNGSWQRSWTVIGAGRDMISTVEPDQFCIQTKWKTEFAVGTKVRWTQNLGFPAIDAVGGPTELVRNGENVVPLLDLQGVASHGPDNWYIRKNPRTGLGVSADGKIGYIVVAEGRIPESVGLRLKEFGKFFIDKLHVGAAVNMDGGGSSHMWIRDQGLVADSCYGDGTVSGVRPAIFATSIFER